MSVMDYMPIRYTGGTCRLCRKMRKIKHFKKNGIKGPEEMTLCDDCQKRVDKATEAVEKKLKP